jgi:hypothetical protein
MVVRRFSIVPICLERLFILVGLSPVYLWFADEVGLCVALVLHLWEHRNFVLLFEHMLFLVECIGYVRFVRRECMLQPERRVCSSVGPCGPYILCNLQEDFHHRGHIGHH